jgi:YD repeat-containing protein
VQYGYDAANRLITVTDWAGRTTTYQYDQDNRPLKDTRPDGSALTQSYDAAGQLLELKDVDAKGNVIDQYDYTYDSNDNVKTEQLATSPQPFTMPDTVCTYTYDNRVATFNGQTVTYDADGNMTYGPLNGSMRTYIYDAWNRLIQAGSATYAYDDENNRIGVADTVYQAKDSYVINPQSSLS